MVRSRTGAWLITATVAAVVTATMGSAPALAATAADQIAQLNAVQLVGTEWRANLAPTLAAATEFKKDKTVKEPLRGKLLARTLRLPARIELSADAAIIADSVVLAERTLSIEAHGHKLTILPVSAVRSEAKAGRAGLNFEANGTDGQAGSAGAGGEAGQTGQSGEPGGTFYDPSQQCYVGRTGGGGGMGGSGKTGGQGGSGTQGTAGGSLYFDVPNGSTESYVFSAHGGRGGDGGYGGTGGAGGTGGTGGTGGDTSCPAFSSVGGDGGPGGQGGSAGNGGNGGGGGSGGHGGTITVSYPPGYDPARISADAAGGAGGGSGPPGTPGTVGFGGLGGQGGWASASGQYGQQGWPGMPGMTAFFGSAGPGGTNGADGSVSLNGRPTTLTLTTDAPAYEVGQQARYTLSGGTPNSPICWSSTRNGTPVEVNSCTAQTDGFGGWSGLSPVWTGADVGTWTKSATVSGRTVSASFSVAPAVPVTIATDSSYYPPYTAGTMTVTGPPNQPIYWTTRHNGQPTFEQNSQFGQTDASGRFSRSIPAWQWSDQVGTYVTQARIGARTAQVLYDLGHCGYTWSGGKVFASGELYIGCKGTFAMQGDGNLVIYDEIGRAKWASNTYSPGAFAAIQGDGNLVIYTTYGYAIWASNTYSPGATLSFQGDGNLVIYTWYGYPIWASNTGH